MVEGVLRGPPESYQHALHRSRTLASDVTEVVDKELEVESLLLCVERNRLRWFGYLSRTPPGGFGHVQRGEDGGED